MRQRSREQVIAASLAVLVTTIIVIEFIVDAKMGTAPPPRITYVELYSPKRSDADIVAQQKKDMAEKKAFEEYKKREFQKLENRLGMD